jgi:hypothetical protein
MKPSYFLNVAVVLGLLAGMVVGSVVAGSVEAMRG